MIIVLEDKGALPGLYTGKFMKDLVDIGASEY